MPEATEVGSIIGYLVLNRSDWTTGVAATKRDASELGRLSPSIRIQTNSGAVIGQLAAVDAATRKLGESSKKAGNDFKVGLIPALLAIAPAAVPIAGVAGGALLGLVPVAATVMLAVKGISNGMKDGTLQASQYGGDIKSLQDELSTLQGIAAGGIMAGVDKGLAQSKGLFQEVNGDVQTMSNQLGQIIAGAGPALLKILTALNPLFVTFGNLVSNGAQHLEDWATNSTGVQSFVAYIQAELPDVMKFLGQVVVLFSHLAQAAAPFGAVLLNDINLFVGALNKIPISVLAATIPIVVSLYAAFKTYGAVTAIVTGVNNAIESMKGPFTSTAATAVASSATQAAAAKSNALAQADAAAEIANSHAAMALSYENDARAMIESSGGMDSLFQSTALTATGAAQAITDSWAGTASLFQTDATRIIEASVAQSAAFQGTADAAVLAAGEIAAASTGAADVVVAEGKVASVGWTSMLGPIGAVVVGVGLLSTMFLGNKKSAQDAAAAADLYANSVKSSTVALSLANIQTTNANLTDKDATKTKKSAVDMLAQLKGATDAYGQSQAGLAIKQSDLALAVNGSAKNYDALAAKLKAVAAANQKYVEVQQGNSFVLQANGYNKTGQSANSLLGVITKLRKGLQDQILTQEQLNTLNEAAAGITDKAAVAAAALYGLHKTDGVAAYLAAKKAADDNTASTKAQTLAFQLENNAAGLVNAALQTLSGQNLSNAQAQTALDQATLSLTTSLKTNGSTTADNTAKGVANRQAIEGAASALRGKYSAEASATGSTVKATAQYRKNATALLDQIGKLDGTNSAAYKYAQQLLKTPAVVKTKIDLEDEAAQAQLRAFRTAINNLPRSVSVNVAAAISAGIISPPSGHRASGGPIDGSGPKGVDSVPIVGAPGEWVINDKAVDQLTRTYGAGAMKAINNGMLPKMTMPTASGAAGSAPVAAAPVVAAPASDQRPIEVKVYPKQAMDANAVGAAAARWLSTLGV